MIFLDKKLLFGLGNLLYKNEIDSTKYFSFEKEIILVSDPR